MTNTARTAYGQDSPEIQRVLVVDDRPDIRMLVCTRLRMMDNVEIVGEGSNGSEALILVSALAPDVVVLDLDMPVMRGDEAIPRMRELAPGVRIVLFTGAAREDVDAIAEEARPDAVVTKGGSLSELAQTVKTLMEMGPNDVLRVALGTIPLDLAVTAFDTWVGLNMRILDSLARGDDLRKDQLAGATPDELQALVGVYAHLGDNLQKAAREQAHEVVPIIHLLRTTAAAARRALIGLDESKLDVFYQAWNYTVPAGAVAALAEMRQQLIDALPSSSADENDGQSPAPGQATTDDVVAGAEPEAPAPGEALLSSPGHDQLRREMGRARDSGLPLAVAALAIDEATDHLVDAVSAVLLGHLRDYDLVMRQAPNELLCALPTMDSGAARERMEMVLAALADGAPGARVKCGIAVLEDEDSLESLVARAAAQRAG